MVDEDGFVSVLLEQRLATDVFELAIAGPLRFRIVDRDPTDPGTLREQDWDDPSDFARIVRSLSLDYQWDEGSVNLELGELNGVTLGHGSVVDAFFNSTDMDHYQGGVLLTTEWAGNGLEFMIEDVISPDVLVGRLFVAPLSWFIDGEWPRRVELGYTLGADIDAPYRVLPRKTQPIPVTGIDLSVLVIDTDSASLMPYGDLMIMDGEIGLHAGLAADITLPTAAALELQAKVEYRRVGADYHPALFNPFYEYRRLYYETVAASTDSRTLADHLATEDLPPRNGFMADVALLWHDGLRIGARYDTEGRDRAHWVMFRLDLFPWPDHAFSAFYAGQDLTGGATLFSTDALIGIAARNRIIGPLDFFAEFAKRWRRTDEQMALANEVSAGLGIFLSY